MTNPELTDDEQDLIELLDECKRLITERAGILSSHIEHTSFRGTAVEIMRKLQDMAWPNESHSQQAGPSVSPW